MILYIDDEKSNLDVFQICFMDDFEITITTSVQDAIETIKNQNIKVLLTDHFMPEMLGLELIEYVNIHFPKVVCMVLSAYPKNEIMIDNKDFKGTVYKFLTKPWNAIQIKESLQSAIEKYDLNMREAE